MELNLDTVEPGRAILAFEEEALSPSEGEALDDLRVSGELTIDAMDQRLLVTGSFEARREVACDRCARRFVQSTTPEIELMILRNPSRADDPEDDEDAWVIHQQRGEIELDSLLREAVVLAEPQKALCHEDCKGLCPRCGTDLNERSCDCPTEERDSRWAKLAELKTEEGEAP